MITVSCPSGHVVLLDDDVVVAASLSVGSHGYAQFWTGGTCVLLHRWLLGLEIGVGKIADHINHNIMDNRLANLRVVTPTESNLNREIAARDLPTGVYRDRHGHYQARISRGRRSATVGTFLTPEEADTARATALMALLAAST